MERDKMIDCECIACGFQYAASPEYNSYAPCPECGSTLPKQPLVKGWGWFSRLMLQAQSGPTTPANQAQFEPPTDKSGSVESGTKDSRISGLDWLSGNARKVE